ncbi:uncharacterized protein LOC131161964 isoform X1 [Malania oleifera]|uniref:uncharacterized protein LOC131161964 isoform X1 n=1 Tax=Malania oleifera TaxID=397392 RepID=UPI0025AE6E98|nr:uncharacterized protein LOC131161964 isoform X1 [Malania oleifera]
MYIYTGRHTVGNSTECFSAALRGSEEAESLQGGGCAIKMAAAAEVGQPGRKEMKEEAQGMESRIKSAMRSLVGQFKEQADSLTFEGVRRLLEKDLGLETYALDVHKRFVKQCLSECLDGADDENASNISEETVQKELSSGRGEAGESPEGAKLKKVVKEPSSEGEEKMEDSPVMGLLTGQKKTKSETEEAKATKNKVALSESTIKKAILKRASHIRENSEKITMASVRRFLEEDLKLEEKTLDPYKKFIGEQVDKVLKVHEVSKVAAVVKNKSLRKNSHSKASAKISNDGSSDSSDNGSEEVEKEDIKPKRKIAPKGKMQSEEQKKRKRLTKETKLPSKKQKPAETVSEEDSDAEDGNLSEDGRLLSSDEKLVKKKEVLTPVYGKRVEHLKSIIKSCGMSVPPAIYKRVKQAPEDKREARLIKELEEILSREGLSPNPSEKEIKEVKKKKERAKELEGIDMGNIVSSSRRRSTTSFIAPPKPIVPVQTGGDDEVEDSDDEGDDEDDDEGDDEDDENDDDDGDEESQSEEFSEDDEDSD